MEDLEVQELNNMKKNLIKLNSRYGGNYLEQLNNNNEYLLITKVPYYRQIFTENNCIAIDLNGGPMIEIGKVLPEIGKKVKNFKESKKGYIIIFE